VLQSLILQDTNVVRQSSGLSQLIGGNNHDVCDLGARINLELGARTVHLFCLIFINFETSEPHLALQQYSGAVDSARRSQPVRSLPD
jgi:hypothetical protein